MVIPVSVNSEPTDNHKDYIFNPIDTYTLTRPFIDKVQACINQTENGISKHEIID